MSIRSKKAARTFALLAALLGVTIISVSGQAQSRWNSVPPAHALPQQSSSGHVDRKDALLWYATYGDDSKPAVLLLHGGGGSSDQWAAVIRDLMRDYRVVVFDCRGQGRSTNDAAAISYEQMAEDAIAVLNQLDIPRISVVGWSDGANIGFYLALRHPTRIDALVAFAGNASPAGYQPNANPSTMAAYMAHSEALNRSISPTPKRRAEVLKLLSVMWKTLPALSEKDLAAIRVRSAIFHAEHDEVIRQTHSRALAAQIPSARFVMLRGVSHFAIFQNPDGFSQAVREFLEKR